MRYGVSATDPSVYWTRLHTYRNDDVIRAPVITSCLFVNITGTAATSGGSAPAWNTALGATTTDGGITWQAIDPSESLIQDNTVTWAVRCHAGIMADCMIYVDSVSLSEFTGAGVHMRGSLATSSYPKSSVSFWRLQDVSVLHCNGGIFVAGYDDNGGYASGCTVHGSAKSNVEKIMAFGTMVLPAPRG
jgi:hypothetical protein